MAFDLLISPIVGAIGGIATQYMSYKSKALDVEDRKSQRDHDRDMATLTHQQALDMLNAEAAAVERSTLLEGEIDLQKADLQNLNAAMATLPKWSGQAPDDTPYQRWFKIIIEALQTLVRVFVTVGFGVGVGILMFRVQSLINTAISEMQTNPVTPAMLEGVISMTYRGFWELAGLAIGFWFAARSATLKPQRINERGQADQI